MFSRVKSLQCQLIKSYFNVVKFHSHSSLRCDSKTAQTLDAEEVQKFGMLANSWWDESGDLKALHTLNYLRIPFIRDGLSPPEKIGKLGPLQDLNLLDVGCGGGLLSEPLCRLGAASVTGLDAAEDNIKMASLHASIDPHLTNKISYKCALVEDLVAQSANSFDGVIASEILEHVNDPKLFIDSCCSLVKPGGSLFITSLNKTLLSNLLAVIAAERIFKLVPAGAHDWNKFVHLDDLKEMLNNNGFTIKALRGLSMNPFTLHWFWYPDTSINYALHAVKEISVSDSETSSDSDNDS